MLQKFTFVFAVIFCASFVAAQVDDQYREHRPGLVEEEFIYLSAPFAQCHASTIAETIDGTLVAAWFGGLHEGHQNVGIWLSRKIDEKWSKPIEVADGKQADGKIHPCWNPVLFQSKGGPLMLFFKVGPNPEQWWGEWMVSTDNGKTWKERKRLPDDILGPIKNKPIQLESGTILCPSSTEANGKDWILHVESTSDGGKTWSSTGPIHSKEVGGAIQPSILTYPDGRLQIIARNRNHEGRLWQTWSKDQGKTWSTITPLPLPNPNSGTDAVTLKDGRQLLLYNHTNGGSPGPKPRNREMLNLALSTDGEHWSTVATLENTPGAEFSYPAIIQTKDEMVHITYTWQRRLIKHIVIDPTKLSENDAILKSKFEHVTVAAEKGKFFGWPANGGAWCWDNEILVVFKQGDMDVGESGHLIKRSVPQIDVQARSLNGGKTWILEKDIQFVTNDKTVKKLTEPIDFTHKDFAIMFRLTGLNAGKSYFYYTYDRGHTWRGPFEVPMFGEALISARTCVLIESSKEMYAFISGAPKTGEEFSTHVLLVYTKDGGLTWEKVSDVGPASDSKQWFIMPDAVRISKTEIVCGLRYNDNRDGKQHCGIQIWGSIDNGRTWEHRNTFELGSSPPTLSWHREDGKLILFYGNRLRPTQGINAMVSHDKGRTWSKPIALRDDGGGFDLGYTKNVMRSDGKGILFYYYTLLDPKADRTIEATVWDSTDFQ